MSPLQKWMTDHGHPGWYSWLVVIGGAFTSMVVAVGISIAVFRDGQEQIERQREMGRQATCLFVNKINKAYEREPAQTDAGKAQQQAWRELGITFRCTQE